MRVTEHRLVYLAAAASRCRAVHEGGGGVTHAPPTLDDGTRRSALWLQVHVCLCVF
jgi:hypothetical protein